jgi:hypothetical protein
VVSNSLIWATEFESFHISLNISRIVPIPGSGKKKLTSFRVSATKFYEKVKSGQNFSICDLIEAQLVTVRRSDLFGMLVFQMPYSRERHNLSSRLAN